MTTHTLIVRDLGLRDYEPTWRAMREFTDSRDAATPSELWIVEHPPVFTQGQAGKAEHVLAAGDIPVVQTDRGGQVTYHGPGQLVMYLLLSLRETGLGIRRLVIHLEQAVIDRALDLYDGFDDPAHPVPVVRVRDDLFVSELYHGPTRAFKDMALQPFGVVLSSLAMARREAPRRSALVCQG